jgi:hypothetical protein
MSRMLSTDGSLTKKKELSILAVPERNVLPGTTSVKARVSHQVNVPLSGFESPKSLTATSMRNCLMTLSSRDVKKQTSFTGVSVLYPWLMISATFRDKHSLA